MIDFDTEDIFLLSGGRVRIKSRPSPATMWRWAMKGIRGIKLETVVIGGRRYTSAQAFERFTRSLNAEQAAVPDSRLRTWQKSEAARRAKEMF